MSDELFRSAVSPIVAEVNARRLVNILAEFPDGCCRSEDLRIRHEQITGLRRATYYDSLAYCKHQRWITGGGGKGAPLRLSEYNVDGDS